MQCFPCIVCSYVILLCLILQLESGLNIAGWCCNLSLIAGGSIMDYFSPLKFSTTKFERKNFIWCEFYINSLLKLRNLEKTTMDKKMRALCGSGM